MLKEIIIIAGANGTGKTTFAKSYMKENEYPFLNADEIAKSLENDGIEFPMLNAGKIFFNRLRDYISNNESFIVETTLSGNYINRITKRAKASGYAIKMIYMFVDDPKMKPTKSKIRY